MSQKKHEKRPLLESFLECSKGSDEEAYSEVKWTRPMGLKGRIKASKGRAKHMALGAAAIINRWPDHLLFWWLGSASFLMITVACFLMLACISRHPDPTLNYQDHCVLKRTHADRNNMFTKTNVYLHVIVNDGEFFEPSKYKSQLTSTLKYYPSYNLNVFVLFNDLLESDYKRNTRFKDWEIYHKGIGNYKFFDTSSADVDDNTDASEIDIGATNVMTGDTDSVKIIQSTFSNYFKHSPLRNVWKNISKEILPMALRILSLWEHGGISMPWNLFLDKTHVYRDDKSGNSRLRNLIDELKRNFSQSYASPIDRAQIKQSVLDDLKFELRGISTEAGIDFSSTSEINKAFRTLKAIHTQRVRGFYKNNKKIEDVPSRRNLFITPSEEKYARMVERGETRGLPESFVNDSGEYFYSSYYYYSYSDSGKSPCNCTCHNVSSSSSYSSQDGLPVSRESKSVEFKLRPQQSPINDVIKEFVKGKNKNGSSIGKLHVEEVKSRMKRELSPRNKKHSASLEYSGKKSENGIRSKLSDKSSGSISVKSSKSKSDSGKSSSDSSKSSSDSSKSSSESSDSDSEKYESTSNEIFNYKFQSKPKPFMSDAMLHEQHNIKNLKNSFADFKDDSNIDEGIKKIRDALQRLPVLQKPMLDSRRESLMKSLWGSSSEKSKSSSSSSSYLSYNRDDSDSVSFETLEKLLSPVSGVLRRPQLKVTESKDYKQIKAFEHLNVFALPNKQNITLDYSGFYFSTRWPCNAFLGQLISILQKKPDITNPYELINTGLSGFCKDQEVKKCKGITML